MTKEEDPNFSPEVISSFTVCYVASTTRNRRNFRKRHNHLRSYRSRYLLETGSQPQSKNTPEEWLGEMMCHVISHEIGWTSPQNED